MCVCGGGGGGEEEEWRLECNFSQCIKSRVSLMNIYFIGSSDGSVGLVSGTSPISIAPSLRYTSATSNVYSPKSVYISPHSSVTSTTPPPSVVNMPPLPSITSTLSSPSGANVSLHLSPALLQLPVLP